MQLCLRSWYGHPEHEVINARYVASKVMARWEGVTDADGGGGMVPLSWTSGLRCWNLLDEVGGALGRVYEPTAETPRWVWTDDRGDQQRRPLCSMEKLTAMMVEYRLKGGLIE